MDIDADSLLASDGPSRTELAEAEEWLASLLARGTMPVAEIKQSAEAEGHSWRTALRAKKCLCVRSDRQGYGKGGRFVWSLPDAAPDAGH